MMGSKSDPADGKAVAGSVFAAVVVYAVCYTLDRTFVVGEEDTLVEWVKKASLLVWSNIGLPRFLRFPGIFTRSAE